VTNLERAEAALIAFDNSLPRPRYIRDSVATLTAEECRAASSGLRANYRGCLGVHEAADALADLADELERAK
jgi:hypothetical protein